MNREVYLINQVFFAYLPACMHARLHGNAGHTYTGRRPAAVWGLTVSTESYRYCYAEVVENDIRYMQSYNKQYVILKPRTKIGQGQLSRATARLSSFTKDSSRKKKIGGQCAAHAGEGAVIGKKGHGLPIPRCLSWVISPEYIERHACRHRSGRAMDRVG